MKTRHFATIVLAVAALAACTGPSSRPVSQAHVESGRILFDSPVFEPLPGTSGRQTASASR